MGNTEKIEGRVEHSEQMQKIQMEAQIINNKAKVEEKRMQEEAQATKEAQEFVERNLILLEGDAKGNVCVDGRHLPEDIENNKNAVPGGDLGLPMALLDARIGLSPKGAFDLVNGYLKSIGGSFTWHSDKHVEDELKGDHHSHEVHDGNHVGCGHCNAAIKNAKQYGIDGNSVKELLDLVRAEQKVPESGLTYIELPGDHAEKAIFVVNSDNYTVSHSDMNGSGEQYFVYDQKRYFDYLAKFVEYAKGKGQDIDLEVLKVIIGEHTNATLGLLGSSKNKPIYEVNINEDRSVTIVKVGVAPDHTKRAA